MIVIVASELDSHADAVLITLRNLGFEHVLRIDLETAHGLFNVRVQPDLGSFQITDVLNLGRCCNESGIRTVWWRRAVNFVNRRHLEIPQSDNLDSIETYWAIRFFLEALPSERFPLSHPLAMRAAANKMHQLKVAFDLGLRVPDTLFTNDKEAMLTFAAKHGQLVVKGLKAVLVHDLDRGQEYALLSRPVSAARLRELAITSRGCSLFCQERIFKTADIRLNLFPSRAIACRIDNSKLSEQEVDWRETTFEHNHQIIQIPHEIESACRHFLTRFGLRWGAFDFGLTRSGEWVFFECNPNGQWLWIEILTGAPLSKLVGELLLDHHERAPML
jgi:glutathione synthase/RimK-type ligase-like ATP-grasp enzyme